MNLAERVDDVDYEPDVLKFKQIWAEMKDTKKDSAKQGDNEAKPNPSTIKNKNKPTKTKE